MVGAKPAYGVYRGKKEREAECDVERDLEYDAE